MSAFARHLRKGFTLIELMVVVTIIAILAALIVPALQRAQAAAMSRQCMSRVRAIAGTIRAYASNWDSWTNADRDHFVKEFGYVLSTEQGYDAADTPGNWISNTDSVTYQRHLRAKEFRCPVDEGPEPNTHGVPSSFRVSSSFAGQNLANLHGEANKILAVSEVGARHATPGGGDGQERHFVMADLSTTLGFRGNYLPGIVIRIWHRSSDAGIRNVPESMLPDPDGEGEASGFTDAWNWSFPFLLASKYAGTTDHGWAYAGGPTSSDHHWTQRHGTGSARSSQFPYQFTARADGLIRFPSSGGFTWRSYANDYVSTYFGIGPKGGSSDSTSFQWASCVNAWSTDSAPGWFDAEGGAYYPFQATFSTTRNNWWGGGQWVFHWRNNDTGDPDWQQIPNSMFARMP